MWPQPVADYVCQPGAKEKKYQGYQDKNSRALSTEPCATAHSHGLEAHLDGSGGLYYLMKESNN